MTWRWLRVETAEAVHEEQLAEHGGGTGVHDTGALISAMARAQNLAAYGELAAADLAAAYAFGIAEDQPFVDGNKRTAWVLARLFLAKNGLTIDFNDADATVTMLDLAAGEIRENELADWFRERISPA